MELHGVADRLTRVVKPTMVTRWPLAALAIASIVVVSACGNSDEVGIESAEMYRGYDEYEILLDLATCVFSPSADVRETTRRVEITVKRGAENAAPCQRTLNVRLSEPFDKERQLIDAATGRPVEMKFLIEG